MYNPFGVRPLRLRNMNYIWRIAHFAGYFIFLNEQLFWRERRDWTNKKIL